MKRLVTVLICLGVLVTIVQPAGAQEGVSMKRKAQNKLLALRAARVDAIRKLAERIKGLSINAETSVRDFVTEYDEINTSVMAYLSGIREKGKPRFMEDGTCEVKLEVTLREVIVNLKQNYKRYYKGDKVKIEDFEKMIVTHKDKVISETGMGAPRSEAWETGAELIVIKEGESAEKVKMSDAARALWMKYAPGRARLMALRAARTDAQRRLAERIKGVYIDAETTVRDFVTESDLVEVTMQTVLRGARETGIRYHDDELIVEVEMTVKLRTVYADLKTYSERHYKDDKVKIRKLEQLALKAEDTVITETGMGVPPEKYLKDATPAIIAVVQTAGTPPPWATRMIREIGQGALDTDNTNVAQAKLMAFRAAELDARRKLAER
ncbi:MAG: hypothetical protein ACYSTL_05835, partial [Planctomycetota bacterium]